LLFDLVRASCHLHSRAFAFGNRAAFIGILGLLSSCGLMFRIRVEDDFDASHIIPGHPGKCKNLHGHTYRVEVFVTGDKLDGNDILEGADFTLLKKNLSEIIVKYDHKHMNDVIAGNPTAENIAKTTFRELKELGTNGLEKVRIWESPRSYAEYWE
jgi:6-pyruvoyltetrahydropterin/6-carboxytetrahydropterin synthase